VPFSMSVLLAEMQPITEPFTAEILGGLYVVKLMIGKRVSTVSCIQQRSSLSTGQTYSTCSILYFLLSEEMGDTPDRRLNHCIVEYRYEEESFLHLHHELNFIL